MNKIELKQYNASYKILARAPLSTTFTTKIKGLLDEIGQIRNPKARADFIERIYKMLEPFEQKIDTWGEPVPNPILEKAAVLMREFRQQSAEKILGALGFADVNWIKGIHGPDLRFDKDHETYFMSLRTWEVLVPLFEELLEAREKRADSDRIEAIEKAEYDKDRNDRERDI